LFQIVLVYRLKLNCWILSYYHQVLNIPIGASKAEIKKAFRTLSKQYHPDLNSAPGAKKKFMQIHEAYKFLTVNPNWKGKRINPIRRKKKQPTPEEIRLAKARKYARKKAKEALRKERILIRKIINVCKKVGYLILFLNALIIIDYWMLPLQKSQVEVVRKDRGWNGMVVTLDQFTPEVITYPHAKAYYIVSGCKGVRIHTGIFGFTKRIVIYDVNKKGVLPGRGSDGYYMKIYVAPLIILVLLIALFAVEFDDSKLSTYVIGYFLVGIQIFATLWSP